MLRLHHPAAGAVSGADGSARFPVGRHAHRDGSPAAGRAGSAHDILSRLHARRAVGRYLEHLPVEHAQRLQVLGRHLPHPLRLLPADERAERPPLRADVRGAYRPCPPGRSKRTGG